MLRQDGYLTISSRLSRGEEEGDAMGARWERDTRGRGIGDGRPFMPGVAVLLDEMERAHWVAEEPEMHLLPALRRVCEEGDRFTIVSAVLWNTIYEVRLDWHRVGGRLRELRADIFALVGAVAESQTYVRQRVGEDAVTYDVTTGTLDVDSPFEGHGHLLRLQVGGEVVERMLRDRTV
jgi:hypothetical protein